MFPQNVTGTLPIVYMRTVLQVWTGNHDANSVHRVYFNETIRTRYLRIYPQRYSIYRCLRVEVYGCSIQRPTQNGRLSA